LEFLFIIPAVVITKGKKAYFGYGLESDITDIIQAVKYKSGKERKAQIREVQLYRKNGILGCYLGNNCNGSHGKYVMV
jgi:hypothetical protein